MTEKKFASLFGDFASAAATLRQQEYRAFLDAHPLLASQLEETELFVRDFDSTSNPLPLVIVVEGLDGSGKTTLSQALARSLRSLAGGDENIGPLKTPTPSLDHCRMAFDSARGKDRLAARAFYMVSNYVLMAEMVNECRRRGQRLVYVVDRWYGSTCAYSTGKEVDGEPETIDALPTQHFAWPSDLLQPELVFILKLDEAARLAQRPSSKGAA